MPLQVMPAGETDVSRAVAIELKAYGPNESTAALFPGPFPAEGDESREKGLVQQLRASEACRWVKVIDPDIRDGNNMIAFSMWYVWETEWPISSLPLAPVWGPGSNPEACELFFGGMRRKWEEKLVGKPHIYLKLLHTDPEHQRRGAGSMLLQWGCQEADRLGIPCYLEATEEGRPLYEKFGYVENDRVFADLSQWGGPEKTESALMLRPPTDRKI